MHELATRDQLGSYSIDLAACQTLWFNSGSIKVGSGHLGGGVADENTVLLWESTKATTVNVSVGDPKDLGNEWWAVSASDFDTTLQAWGPQALKPPNCGSGCTSLLVYRYLDGVAQPTLHYP